ncbi:4Fe-4S dicluster domain-containing protein [Parabacteroides sp. AM08-6]|uniref:4Fe-4S dicluster domain-containing protein n=1 Tax=Parabacteroides sp. AM08-6 TaxID=2292053 RepID=UPI000F0102D1|nr:4Fe-4S dicluster domain-containing protein [Parabacteroides sp. AM08-6]RHJ87682.1 4Fe-4S dicluster domain-containing protein [Parabacteroides sp. AM08-6]
MKRTNYLKGLRVLLAILFFVPILLFFVDFAGALPSGIHKLLHAQLMPAILGGMVGIIVFQFLLALLFGRIYCSVICSAGVLQDIINRIFCIGKKKKKGVRRFKYHKPANWVRYSILALTVILAVLGFSELCLLLDPYSNFGRIATNLFRPVVMWSNNILADLLMKVDNYSLYHVTISTVSTAGLIAAIIALVLFIVLVIFRGRLFCNTLCPVGALLSLISRYSFFRISFDKEACTHCGNCEHTCKAEAIDSKNLTIDTSRCVDCFNCVSSCAKGGLQYRYQPVALKKEKAQPAVNATDTMSIGQTGANSRRSFLATGVTVAASLPVISAIADEVETCKGDGSCGNHKGKGKGHGQKKWPPLTPPGSISLERFKDKCTGCHLCVVRCPSQVLRPTGLEYGFDYMLKPRLAYISSYCNYECTVCADVCPTGAIKPLTKEEKMTTQVGIATFFINRCIVKTEGNDCGACSEHCPTQAVHMVPYEGTLTIPHVDPDLCIGCGGCESICPVRPMRAIIVKSNEVHKFVEKPKEEEVKEVEVDDFGF